TGKPPERVCEHARRQTQIEVLYLRSAVTERERAGNNRPCRCSPNQIEPIAKTGFRLGLLIAQFAGSRPKARSGRFASLDLFLQELFDALQESDSDRSAHSATVKRKHALRTLAEQMAVPGGIVVGGTLLCLVHRCARVLIGRMSVSGHGGAFLHFCRCREIR